jgi:uncharacterized protein YodC (DUF2158 family)
MSNSETALKAGDVVQLKSGGPIMTITSVGDQYGTLTAWCTWFDGKKPETGTYPMIVLEITKP